MVPYLLQRASGRCSPRGRQLGGGRRAEPWRCRWPCLPRGLAPIPLALVEARWGTGIAFVFPLEWASWPLPGRLLGRRQAWKLSGPRAWSWPSASAYHLPQPAGDGAAGLLPCSAAGAVRSSFFDSPLQGGHGGGWGAGGAAALAVEPPGPSLLAAAAQRPLGGRRQRPAACRRTLGGRPVAWSAAPHPQRGRSPLGGAAPTSPSASSWRRASRLAVPARLALVEKARVPQVGGGRAPELQLDRRLDPLVLLQQLRRHQPGSCRFPLAGKAPVDA